MKKKNMKKKEIEKNECGIIIQYIYIYIYGSYLFFYINIAW